MSNLQTISSPKMPSTDSMWEGTKLGCLAGLKLSTAYAIAGMFIAEVFGHGMGYVSAFQVTNGDWWSNFLFVVFMTVLFLLIMAITPATILGILTGMYLGKLAEIAKERISKRLFVSLSVLSCLTIVVLIHLFFHIPVVLSFQNPLVPDMGVYESYLFTIGIPSVIYIFTGGWVGWQLYSKVLIQIGKET